MVLTSTSGITELHISNFERYSQIALQKPKPVGTPTNNVVFVFPQACQRSV